MDREDVVYIYRMEYYAVIKNWNPAICNGVDELEGIMLREISQSEKDSYHMISPMWGIWEAGRGFMEGREKKMKQDVIREGDKP